MKKKNETKHYDIFTNKNDKEYCRMKQRKIGFIPYRVANSKLKRRHRAILSIKRYFVLKYLLDE